MTKISEIAWMGEEALLLENSKLRLVLLPALGGKAASLFHKETGFELMEQNRLGGYHRPASLKDSFDDYDVSGFDDAFPTIIPTTLSYEGASFAYPDHGEIWMRKMNVSTDNHCVTLFCQGQSAEYDYEKTIGLEEDKAVFSYRIRYNGNHPWPCLWAMHGLVRYEENMRLIYPAGTATIMNAADSPQLGKEGKIWDIHTPEYNFFAVPSYDSNAALKYYVNGRVAEGLCGYYYPSSNVSCLITFDPEQLPYLGFWVTAGGHFSGHNLAFEPANGYYDGIETALANHAIPILHKGEELSIAFSIRLCQEAFHK